MFDERSVDEMVEPPIKSNHLMISRPTVILHTSARGGVPLFIRLTVSRQFTSPV